MREHKSEWRVLAAYVFYISRYVFRYVALLFKIVYDQSGNVKTIIGGLRLEIECGERFRKGLCSRCRSKFMLPEGLACHSLLALTDGVGNVEAINLRLHLVIFSKFRISLLVLPCQTNSSNVGIDFTFLIS